MSDSFRLWVPTLSGVIFGAIFYGYAWWMTRRFDARIKRDREKAAAPPAAE